MATLTPFEKLRLRQADIDGATNKYKAKAMRTMGQSFWKASAIQLFSDLSPYLVLILIIVLIIVLVKHPSALSPSRPVSAIGRAWDWLMSKLPFSGLITNSRMIFQSYSLSPPKIPCIPRTVMMSGRCDQLRWIQDASDGAKGFCYSAIRPKDIIWDIDKTQMPEYRQLPDVRRNEVDARMKIRIPYSPAPEDSFFVPRCDLATYKDVMDPKDPTKELPANLLDDTGLTCKFREVPSTRYVAKERAPDGNLNAWV